MTVGVDCEEILLRAFPSVLERLCKSSEASDLLGPVQVHLDAFGHVEIMY